MSDLQAKTSDPEKKVGEKAPEKDSSSSHHDQEPTRDYAGSIQDPDVEPELGFKTFAVIAAVASQYLVLVWFLVTAGLQSANIVASVGGATSAIWVQNASTLVSVVIAPPLSRISDAVGRKWLVISCGLLGVLGTGLIGGATSMGMAIAGGTLAGFLAALQGPWSAIASEVTPRRYRGLAQGLMNWGPTLGGIIGATASQRLSMYSDFAGSGGWRAAFYWISGGGAFSLLLLALFYNPPPVPNPENRSYFERWIDFDWQGTLLLIAGITPLTIGLTWGGGAYPWKNVHSIATTAVGGAMLIVFGLHQWLYTKTGLFHHRLFSHRNFALAITASMVEGVFYFVYNGYFGQQCAIIYDSRPMQFGLFFCAFFLPQLIFYPVVGLYTKRTRDLKGPLIAGYVLFIGIMIGLAQTRVGNASRDGAIAAAVLAGVAFVPAEVLLQTVGQLAVPAELIGTAAALNAAVRSFGGVVGVAIATSIFNSKVTQNLPKYVVPVALEAGLPETSLAAFIPALASGNAAAIAAIPGVTADIIAVSAVALKQGFAQSFKFIWYTEIPFMALALICVLGLSASKLREQMDWIINRPVEEIHHKHHHVAEKTDLEK